MPRIIKFMFFLLLFGIIFEAGLLSSYTIVTSQPPNVGKIIDMQVSKLSAIWNTIGIGSHKNNAQAFNVTNPDPVAQALKNKTQLDGINIDTIYATISKSLTSNMANVTITATGYKESQTGGSNASGNSTGGQIVITPSETYSLTAIAIAKKKDKGVEVDVNTIRITSLKKLHNQ